MLIDEFLPQYDLRSHHRVTVHAPIEQVYESVRRLDIAQTRLARWLFRLRGIPVSTTLSLDNLLEMRFILLGDNESKELLLGLVGRFWILSGKLQRLDAERFRTFTHQGYAKAVWNFSVTSLSDHSTLLETETRVHCLDSVSRRRFRLYWLIIGVFSRLIRREILQTIKHRAERLQPFAA